MRRFVKFATALSLLAAPAIASAQSADNGTWVKAPIFVLQPGVVTVNAISAPDDADSKSYFNARFAVVLPTSTPWFSFVAGTQIQPNAPGAAPAIFYGGIIPIAPISKATNGMLGLSIDPLGVTTAGGSEGTNFWLEGALSLAIGKMMMANMGPTWAGTGVYFLIDQQMTRLPKDANGDKDSFNPVLLYGLTIPIGFGK
jgi:hypothetical protein